MRFMIAILALTAFVPVCGAATIYVPGNYSTIQDAINASANGDTILVSPGTYWENIDFAGKTIVLKGDGYNYHSTIIDGTQSGSVVTFRNGEGPQSVITGFSITNGSGTFDPATGGTWGGGIFCDAGSSPTIWKNNIEANEADHGGGIGCLNDSCPVIAGNRIAENTAADGGGVNCRDATSCRIENNSIFRNVGSGDGGGVVSVNTALQATGNEFFENRAEGSGSGYGGGLLFAGGTLDLSGNEFRKNTCASTGGAIYGTNALARIENNSIIENSSDTSAAGIRLSNMQGGGEVTGNVIADNVLVSATGNGAAIDCRETDILVVNCVVYGNFAPGYGGGIMLGVPFSTQAYAAEIINSTLVDNRAVSCGGGLCAFSYTIDVVNSILWRNSALQGPEICLGDKHSPVTLTLSHSDLEGGIGSVVVPAQSTFIVGAGVIDRDPLFADPKSGDLHLSFHSPCIDSGDSQAPGLPADDYESDPRVVNGAVDMGADEYSLHLYNVGYVSHGTPLEIKVVGIPGAPVVLGMSRDVLGAPDPTPYGDLWLVQPFSRTWIFGPIPSSGILAHPVAVTAAWYGKTFHCQALVGPWSGGPARLSNLMTLSAVQ